MQRTTKAALAGLAALGLAGAQAQDTLNVYAPEAVVLGEVFTLRWDSVGANTFDVELFVDSPSCSGSPVALCSNADGCVDSQGDLNMVIPTTVGSGRHSIKLSLHDEPAVSDCTGAFTVSEETVVASAGAILDVTALADEEIRVGMEVNLAWQYDDGEGGTQGRFSIGLYNGTGCQGTPSADLCGRANGCPDTNGEYAVTIPGGLFSGEYSIKVGIYGATSPEGCTPPFTVVGTVAVVVTLDNSPNLTDVGIETNVDTPWEGYLFPKSECNASIPVEVRYAESTKKAYFEHTDGTTGGCATLSDLLALRQERNGTLKGPLYPLDPVTGEKLTDASTVTGHWLLEADMYVRNGVTLQLHGSKSGGDCDALRIKSTDTEFYNLRGHGGNLDILDTNITSWDTDLAVPGVRNVADYSTKLDDEVPRSYISCLSEVITDPDETCHGNAKKNMGTCRMDIVRSEIGYLGYYGAEAYGLTWKVRGYCKDKSNNDLFDQVNTYGDVIDSDIHHLFYGLYTYGHLGGLWTGNLMHDNEWYGFDPHDDSDYLTIHNNRVWNNGKHGIIASKRCDHVSIQNNEVWNGGATAAGIFLHRSSDDAIVRGNHIHDMQDSGLATMESFNIEFSKNLIERCKYGVRLSLAAGDNSVVSNTFSDLTSYGFFTYIGSNLPDVDSNVFRPYGTIIESNTFDTGHMGKLKEADGTIVRNNTFTDVATIIEVDDSLDTIFTGNTFPGTIEVNVKNGACFVPPSDFGDEIATPCA